MTECIAEQLSFPAWGAGSRREVRLDFQAGRLSSDGGLPLLAQLEQRRGILRRFAACFHDHRNALLVEHPVTAMVSQLVLGLALGYEDLRVVLRRASR